MHDLFGTILETLLMDTKEDLRNWKGVSFN